MKRWYVVQVYTGFEEEVKADLLKRIEAENKQDLFGEVLVPRGESSGFWEEESGEKEKIFPGYVLVNMEFSPETYKFVSSTSRVYKILGGNNPHPLSAQEVDRIKSQISGRVALGGSKLPFGVGNEVHIASGPLNGFSGIVDKIDEEHEKLTVMVSLFGRLTPVELEFNQIKK